MFNDFYLNFETTKRFSFQTHFPTTFPSMKKGEFFTSRPLCQPLPSAYNFVPGQKQELQSSLLKYRALK